MDLTNSKALLARSRRVIPDATHTYSKGPAMFPDVGVPFAVDRAHGCIVTDVDGNEYIDWTAALCAMSLGYNSPPVSRAVSAQLVKGGVFGLPHRLETECAERFCAMTGYDMVRFAKNGSDATSAAVRLARAITGRDIVIKMKGHYHGCADWAQAWNNRCLGIPRQAAHYTQEWQYGEIPEDNWFLLLVRHETTIDPNCIACVILEPVQTGLPPRGYLKSLKEWCDRNGVLLIFDEVITGFRCANGGWAEIEGVRPDLACFGKAIANGFPLSAIVGKRQYMEQLGKAFMSYTFSGDAVSLAACMAVMDEYSKQDVPEKLALRGRPILSRLRKWAQDLPHVMVSGFPWRAVVRFPDKEGNEDVVAKSLFLQQCFAHGIMTNGQFIPTMAHTPEVIQETLDALDTVFQVMHDAAPDYSQALIGAPLAGVGVRR